MTEEAVSAMGDAWMTLRNASGGVIDIDVRRYHSMMRLAFAHARLRLGDEVTEEDAEAAYKHISKMMSEWGYDVTGESPDVGGKTTDDDDDGGRNGELGDEYDERTYELDESERRRVREEARGNDYDAGIIAHNLGLAENQVRPVLEAFRADDDDAEDEGDDEEEESESIGEIVSQPRQSSDD